MEHVGYYAEPHPLAHVPPAVLDAARKVLDGGVRENDVDPEMAIPLADAVVAAVVPFVPQWHRPGSDPGA